MNVEGPLDPLNLELASGKAGELGRLGRLAQKELREILRDRRTILTLVLMPLLLYPLLTVVFQQFFLSTLTKQQAPVYRIGFRSADEANFFLRYLALEGALPAETAAKDDRPKPRMEHAVADDPDASLRTFAIDVYVARQDAGPPAISSNRDLAADFELRRLEGAPIGVEAVEHLSKLLARANEVFLRRRLGRLNLSQRPVPVKGISTIVADPGRSMAPISLSALVPLILILMTITGAVYPAIDLTAGERERNTLEILVAAPVPRLSLLLAKYAAVVAVAMLTATVNLATMTITLSVSGLAPAVFGPQGLSATTVLQVFGLLLLFAAFFSAMLLILTSFAQSFKEAQAYLVPLMLLSLAPGVVSLAPGLKLEGGYAAAPLLNIVLLSRDLLNRQAEPVMAVFVVLITAVYALAAIAAAARIFGDESVLYSTPRGWRELIHRPQALQEAPRIGGALACVALLFPAMFLATNSIAVFAGAQIVDRILWINVAQIALFLVFPLLAALHGRVRLSAAFALRKPGFLHIAAAGLIGVCMWPLGHELILALQSMGAGSLSAEYIQEMANRLDDMRRQISPFVLLATFAVLPAIVEEALFRGYLFAALDSRLRAWNAILASAAIFGLFHFIVKDSLAVERLIPSTLLGVLLGWVRHRSGSIFPSMIVHGLHNGSIMLLLAYKDELAARGVGVEESAHLPAAWLAVAGLGVVGGLFLMRRG